MYKPLPERINDSTVRHRRTWTLFAKKEGIAQGTNYRHDSHQVEWHNIVRTPLGGFINHSNTPNVVRSRTPAHDE